MPAARSITLSASPYIGNEFWQEGLEIFHAAICGVCIAPPETVFSDYGIAAHFDVHRCISDLWLSALRQAGYIEHVSKKMSAIVAECDEASGFRLLKLSKFPGKVIVPDELRDFDPWDDRSLDGDVPDAMFADEYIDKFFDIRVDEFYIFNRKTRRRPNGHLFQPVKELPRYAAPHILTHNTYPADPLWRKVLDKAASDQDDD